MKKSVLIILASTACASALMAIPFMNEAKTSKTVAAPLPVAHRHLSFLRHRFQQLHLLFPAGRRLQQDYEWFLSELIRPASPRIPWGHLILRNYDNGSQFGICNTPPLRCSLRRVGRP